MKVKVFGKPVAADINTGVVVVLTVGKKTRQLNKSF
jgi:hypothetical protein